MVDVFAKVMEIVSDLYNLESPFFGLKYIEIVAGFFVLRLAVALFHSLVGQGSEITSWGSKKYDN